MASPLNALHMKASDSCKIQVFTWWISLPEGWPSGWRRRPRKPLRVFRLSVSSNLTPSAIKGSIKPLRRFQFCSISRKAQLLTTDIHWVFRGLKAEPDTEIGQKRNLLKGFTERCPSWLKEHDWKSCVLSQAAPRVRIPLSPPLSKKCLKCLKLEMPKFKVSCPLKRASVFNFRHFRQSKF